MKTSKIIQIVLGILMIIVSYFGMLDSLNIPVEYLKGLVFGIYGLMLPWGIRELIGGLIRK